MTDTPDDETRAEPDTTEEATEVPKDDQIDALGQTINEARQQAEDHGTIVDSDPDPSFVDPDGDGDPGTPEHAPG